MQKQGQHAHAASESGQALQLRSRARQAWQTYQPAHSVQTALKFTSLLKKAGKSMTQIERGNSVAHAAVNPQLDNFRLQPIQRRSSPVCFLQ